MVCCDICLVKGGESLRYNPYAIVLWFALIITLIAGCSNKESENPFSGIDKSAGQTMAGHLGEKWTGDLDEILKRRHIIRVLVSYSKTNFVIVNGRQQGLEYELLHEYEQFLNRRSQSIFNYFDANFGD